MKVFGYVRVSTEEQASNGVSLEAQQRITRYAMMKGWQVADFFIEAGVSGSVPLADRPEGRRLVEAAGKGDVIITARFDRAFRSAKPSSAFSTTSTSPPRRWGRRRPSEHRSDRHRRPRKADEGDAGMP
jgi:DNA invertase Pin-like site-specific DNA recombinase